MNFVDKDLLSVQEARILMERAGEAAEALALFSQEKLDQILQGELDAVTGELAGLARLSAEETGYGNPEDKYRKDTFVCRSLAARMDGIRCVGMLSEDQRTGIAAVGAPVGVIAALCPAAGAVASVISVAAMAVKSGNAVVFAPHPRARRTTGKVVEILARAALEAGIPEGAISCLNTVTPEGTAQLLRHPAAAMILNTGVPEPSAAAGSGKPVIFGGTGPSPVFIERTADVARAVEDILSSRSFDFGIMAASEQYVVADSAIAEQARREMTCRGAYFMTGEEEKKLIGLLCRTDGLQDPETVGKSAEWLARRAGFNAPEGTRVLVSCQRYISDHNPYAKALQCPVLIFYIENDWMRACEKCMELLAGESCCHTLAIHSRDEAVIRQFALKKPVGRILVNTPAAFGAAGATTNLFPSVILGAASAGMGITAENVSPMNLVYLRSVARGVRSAEDGMRGGNGGDAAAYGVSETESPEMKSPETGSPEKKPSVGGPDVSAILRLILDQLTIE